MPLLQHKLAFREVLKYQHDLSIVDHPDDDAAEFELLVVVKVGQDGKFTTESRLQNRSGPIKVPETFVRPGEYQLGQSLPPFLPALPDRAVEPGDLWTSTEGGHQVFYEMTSMKGSVAEIVSRKVTENPRTEVEGLFEFDVTQGRVLLAQTVIESKAGKQRILSEYELLD